MKTNGQMNHGGKLKVEYYGRWAKYMVRFVKEMKARGTGFPGSLSKMNPTPSRHGIPVSTARPRKAFLPDNTLALPLKKPDMMMLKFLCGIITRNVPMTAPADPWPRKVPKIILPG